MPSLVPGYEYDVFISYRQNDNRSEWVSSFAEHLREELAATIKEPVSIYFDENPHDGLLDTHHVDKSLEGKLRCVIFIPVLSHTYCDTKSFAWNNEFIVFCQQAEGDSIGLDVRLINRNVTSRILPIQIHDLDPADQHLFEETSGGPLRSIDFIFKSQGVNRPLSPDDSRSDNLDKTFYRDQINKTANAIEGIIKALSSPELIVETSPAAIIEENRPSPTGITWFWREALRRNVFRAALTYLIVALLLLQVLPFLAPVLSIGQGTIKFITWSVIAGFPLAIITAWYYEASPQGIIRTTSPMSAINTYPPYRKKPFTNTPLVIVLTLTLISSFFYLKYPPQAGTSVVNPKIISIAVLPFENRSGDPGDKYIADGLTDDIINRLAIISQLTVTNRGRIQQYRGELLPYADIASELQVMNLLVGSVQRSGKQIAIRTQLIEGKNDRIVWGKTFERTTDNIIAVQSEIAQVIADQLKVQLNDLEKTRLHMKATESSTAYDFYLRGRSLYYKYKPSANDSAVDQFKLAIALDRRYSRAWAGLGDAFAQMHGRFGREFSWTDSSLLAGNRAIQLDSNLSEGYKALATAYSYRKEYDKAFPLLLKSVELSPTNDQAIGNLGTNYLLRGDLPHALIWEKKGVGMNPKNWIPYQLIGWIYRLLGDLSKAESWLKKSLELNPKVYDTYELLGYTYVSQGRKQEALDLIPGLLETGPDDSRVLEAAGLIAHFAGDMKNAKLYYQKSIDNNPKYKDDRNTFSPIGLGQILLMEGNKIEAEVYLTHAMNLLLDEVAKGSQSADLPFNLAGLYAIRGNKEQSLKWLQKAIDGNWVDYTKIEHGPYFTKFKSDPAFIEKAAFLHKKVEDMRREAEKN